MPVDFNSHIWLINNNKPVWQNIIHSSSSVSQPGKDTFVKSIKVSDKKIDSAYDGIKIEKKAFGIIEKTNENAYLYTITNKNGASVDISTYGATITSIRVPDKNGKITDVTQGYGSVTPYEKSSVGHAGGTIGPCANKINNGSFKINEKEYKLDCNKDNGQTHSHGGTAGFDRKNWKAEVLKDGIKFTYIKKDMDGGYPANVKTSVTYKFDNNNNLSINYEAESDGDTVLNLTNHSYFNLDGSDNTEEGSVMEHIIILPNSSKYTPVNDIGVPTGEVKDTEGTEFDFGNERRLSKMNKSGYDINYVIDNYDGKTLIEAAKVKSEKTGIALKVLTNLPGFQFYTANNLGKSSQPAGKDGKRYEKQSAVCIEPQFFPDAVNTFDEKPLLKKDGKYNRTIIYSFSAED